MLYRYQLGYRFKDGTVAGFVQGKDGPNGSNARMACIADVVKACFVRDEQYEASRLIETSEGLTEPELATIQADWKAGRGKGILATRSGWGRGHVPTG